MRLPTIIQGGMGVGISGWPLARAVARHGALGVVSGVALDVTLARRLQDGDPGGHLRRCLPHFPAPDVAAEILDRYYVAGGKHAAAPYRPIPRLALDQSLAAQRLMAVANFAEVWLAKDGHDGQVGINYLEKMQLATPASLYGALLAGVDAVLMGAGIPVHVPRLLDALARHATVRFPVDVAGARDGESSAVTLDPRTLLGGASVLAEPPPLRRPPFLAIVSSHVLVGYLARDPATRPDGVVLENASAGGHNAPPRGALVRDADGEPVYGVRDAVDVPKVAAAGLPFWLAGGFGTPARLRAALDAGAAGVQVGTPFALCRDSGMTEPLRSALLDRLRDTTTDVRTSLLASPTGFPFKVARLPGTVVEPGVYDARERLCDLGYLRTPYRRDNGAVGYRCPAEPVHVHVRKGGDAAATDGRLCLCNGLTATIGLGQTRADGYVEPPLVTLGKDVTGAQDLLRRHPGGWSAADVLAYVAGDPVEDGRTAQDGSATSQSR